MVVPAHGLVYMYGESSVKRHLGTELVMPCAWRRVEHVSAMRS